MATIIKARTISTVDNRAQMTNSMFVRPFSPPSGWTTLRLAFRFAFTDLGSAAGSTPQFAFGLCSGSTNVYKEATTDHFVGWKSTIATWSRDTNWSVYQTSSTFTFQSFKRIGTTDTNSSGTQVITYGLPYNVAAIRNVIYADYVKGSPNWTLKLFGAASFNAGITDISKATFEAQALLASPSVSQHGFTTDRTLAVDEATNGTLNHINFFWDRSDFLAEICDIQVVRLA